MRSVSFLAACVVAALLSASALAQAPARAPPAPAPGVASVVNAPAQTQPHALTRSDLEAWLDGYMPFALERGDIAGAVVVVVANGAILTSRGYGYANVEERLLVDPARTLFRPGSVAKLFTWTAVMQLVEQGRLDLDADVNTYLDFEIPARDGQPVTLRNLLTHTPGFEEAIKDLIVEHPQVNTLRDALVRWTPQRIYAPGETPAYSNYGAALAGYIVERVSGQSFEDYVSEHIFAPLGMTHSTFAQPVPTPLSQDLAVGYVQGSGEPGFFEHIVMAPAGGLSASGDDMGRFMIAHLNGGSLGQAQILRPETVRWMHTGIDPAIPPLNSMALGFYERDINGRRVVAHAGDTTQFHSELSLFLDEGVGLFISMSSTGREGAAGPVRAALFENFADRYFPGASPDGQVDAAVAVQHAAAMAGTYELTRTSRSNFASMFGLLSQATVTVTPEGSISVPLLRGVNGAVIVWREIAPFVWRDVDGHWRLAAVVEDGEVVRFSIDQFPFMAFDRAPWWRAAALPLLGAALAVLALTALLWPITAFVRWRYKTKFALAGQPAWAYRAARLGALAAVAVFAAWLVFVIVISAEADFISTKSDGAITALGLVSAVLLPAALLGALWHAFSAWTTKRSWFARLWSTLIVASTAVTLAYGATLHLIGASANF